MARSSCVPPSATSSSVKLAQRTSRQVQKWFWREWWRCWVRQRTRQAVHRAALRPGPARLCRTKVRMVGPSRSWMANVKTGRPAESGRDDRDRGVEDRDRGVRQERYERGTWQATTPRVPPAASPRCPRTELQTPWPHVLRLVIRRLDDVNDVHTCGSKQAPRRAGSRSEKEMESCGSWSGLLWPRLET